MSTPSKPHAKVAVEPEVPANSPPPDDSTGSNAARVSHLEDLVKKLYDRLSNCEASLAAINGATTAHKAKP